MVVLFVTGFLVIFGINLLATGQQLKLYLRIGGADFLHCWVTDSIYVLGP